MTRDETINVIHKTIYQFFDGDDGEPMSDKDELLLEVNKAICNNIKALEQEPSGDAISRQAVIRAIYDNMDRLEIAQAVRDLPSVTPKQRTGHWERHYIRPKVYKDLFWYCSACGDKCGYNDANLFEYCPHCGARMESEDKE